MLVVQVLQRSLISEFACLASKPLETKLPRRAVQVVVAQVQQDCLPLPQVPRTSFVISASLPLCAGHAADEGRPEVGEQEASTSPKMPSSLQVW